MSRVDPSEDFRLAETAVRREHLEAVLEQLPTPIVLIEPGSGLITFANRAADELAGGRFPRGTVDERMAGRPATDGAGQPLANADLPSMRIARGEQLRGARLEWRLPDRVLSLLVSGQIVTDGDGRDVGIVVFEDLGPMRAAERLRDESLALLDTIFESAPVGLALHGPDLRFVRVNRELASFNGISVEEHIGRTISELVPSVSPVVEDSVRSVLETGRPITGVEISGETPGRRGIVQTWMCGWYPVRQGSEGEIVGVGAVVTEITERAALLEAERTARERAERAERQAAYLAEVGEILAGSLNWEENLARVVRVSVRAKAQWCTANMLQRDGTIRRLAGAHRDPAREHVLTELQRRYPLTIDDPVGAGSVLRSGRPELMREIDEEVLRSITNDAGHMALVQQLGMASRMIVPIVVRGTMTGTLTFARGPDERPYTLEDLRIVMEVARRASTGIAHAELYRERSHIAHTLQRSLLPPRLPDIEGFELAARYRAAGEGFDVGGDFYDAFETRDGWALAVGAPDGRGRGEQPRAGARGHERGGPARAHRRPVPHGAVPDPRAGHRHARRGERGPSAARGAPRRGGGRARRGGAGPCWACSRTCCSRTRRSSWNRATPSSPTRTACSTRARRTGCWTPPPSAAWPRSTRAARRPSWPKRWSASRSRCPRGRPATTSRCSSCGEARRARARAAPRACSPRGGRADSPGRRRCAGRGRRGRPRTRGRARAARRPRCPRR